MTKLSMEDFDYDLPEHFIAKQPVEPRDASKLLVFNKGKIVDQAFSQLDTILPEKSILVFNDTKVIQARLRFKKESGAKIEIFLLEPLDSIERAMQHKGESVWKCLIGNKKKWKGEVLKKHLSDANVISAELLNPIENIVKFTWGENLAFSEVLTQIGEIPLPPYLNRKVVDLDTKNYQTVYAQNEGAVAAPTAGLHFTNSILEKLDKKRVERQFLTLHVGAGTFKPVKVDDPIEHEMHHEFFSVKKETLEALIKTKGPIIPVGTTSMRTLESLYWYGLMLSKNGSFSNLDQDFAYKNTSLLDYKESFSVLVNYLEKEKLTAFNKGTSIFIRPGYAFKVCDGLVTNFHQPKSTLLLLVSALIGEQWKEVYEHALGSQYRFLSYGDSSLLLP